MAFFANLTIGVILLATILVPWWVSKEDVFLPDCRGEYKQQAIDILEKKGFETKLINLPYSDENSPGTVIEMIPYPFTKVKEGRLITISIAGQKEDVIVPILLNMTIRKAKIKIAEIGLNLDTLIYEYNPKVKENLISHQDPEEGAIRKSGSPVKLHVSKGLPEDYFTVPDLYNTYLDDAIIMIKQEGLRVGEISYQYDTDYINNTVIDQGFPPGFKLTAPIRIDITIAKDRNE